MQDRLNGMRVFAQVVESKSFSAAAQKLGMSKSLASRHVSALEESLAVKLLHRTTRRLSLTDAGAVFYEHCARIVQEAQLAEEHLTRTQAEPAGLVRLTGPPSFTRQHVVPALADFQARYPKIRVHLGATTRTVDLGEEGFDLGIRVSARPADNLVARKLAANRSVLCAAPQYLERHGTPRRFADLAKHPCILFPPLTQKGCWRLRRGRKILSVQVDGPLEADDMETVHAAVLRGLGLGFVPVHMASEGLRRGELIPLFRELRAVVESGVYLVYLPNRTLPSRVRVLVDFLVDRFSPVPPWEVGW